MKRFVLTALMLFAAVGAVLVYSSLLGEREYRRLIAEGDAALDVDQDNAKLLGLLRRFDPVPSP